MPATRQPTERMLRVRGTVQGVGFRPFVLRLANELGINGWVRNDSQGVLVRAVGETAKLDLLAEQVATRAPSAARVTAVEWLDGPLEAATPPGEFSIIESTSPANDARDRCADRLGSLRRLPAGAP